MVTRQSGVSRVAIRGVSKIDNRKLKLAPQPGKPSALARYTVIFWLMAATMVACLVPLLTAGTSVRADVQKIGGDLQAARATSARISTPPSDILKLQSSVVQLESQLSQLNVLSPTLSARRVDWASVMTVVGGYDSRYVALTNITRSENRLVLTGTAARESDVSTFAESLDSSGLFSRVIIQSIQVISGTTSGRTVASNSNAPSSQSAPVIHSAPVIPTNTAAPGALSDGRDAFEPDDAKATPLALGQAQRHNFYADQDADTTTFLAKTGRTYRVRTTELAPGVDTVLGISVSGLVYTNDDAQPTMLSSEIVFQYPGSDATALVTLTNRGQFGKDKWYKILVEEVLPLPTGTMVPSATPTRTFTSAPPSTSTRTPTNTATATPTKTLAPTSTSSPTLAPSKGAGPTSTSTPTQLPTKASSQRGVPSSRNMLGWNSNGNALASIAKEPHAIAAHQDVAKPLKFTILIEIKAVTP